MGFQDTNDYETVINSWRNNSIRFMAASKKSDKKGFRKPQLAAIHSSLAHLISSPRTTATIVMPTGTGKTDTTAAIIVAGKFERTLIIVPTDALRTQTKEKLECLKTLRDINAVDEKILNPIVETITGNISVDQLARLREANIVVTTPATTSLFGEETLQEFTKIFSHLVIDEAHHAAARTWRDIKIAFNGKPCLQFTATPFREDGQDIGGKIIFNYPLSEAQKDGYFQEIEFHSVREYNPEKSDEVIAEKAVSLLRSDLSEGKNHILIARASTQKKAGSIYEIYKKYSDLSPILIHSNSGEKAKALADIREKKHRIIVCVNMLGEGFDLPELKIAALHDQHRSPNITLQFIGRLTRTQSKLGSSKFVANIANQKTEKQISNLYRESSDWGKIVKNISKEKIERQIKKDELMSGFSESHDNSEIFEINPNPKISAIAYRVKISNWDPDNFNDLSFKDSYIEYKSISKDKKILIAAIRHEQSPEWAKTSEIKNTSWDLLVAYYKNEHETLFVHCSGNEKTRDRLIKKITKGYKRIRGEVLFRSLYNIDRLKIQNVGLNRARRNLRFTMHVGTDIKEVISEIEKGTSIKSNIFSTGFEEGKPTSIGCSHKGKLWEMNADGIDYWIDWCDKVSEKINDENITMESILHNTMRAEKITSCWPKNITFWDWPNDIKVETEKKIKLIIDSNPHLIEDIEISDLKIIEDTRIEISITANNEEHYISLILEEDGFRYKAKDIDITQGVDPVHLEDFLNEHPLFLMTNKGEIIDGNYRYFSPASINTKIPLEQIQTWDWGDIDISKESMGKNNNQNTVQWYAFKKIENDYDIIFNDDGSREIADLIGIKESGNKIFVDLYHCKYMNRKDKLGARVSDLDVVAGQAVRSLKWAHSADKIFSQMIYRYQKSIASGFERVLKGTIDDIDELRLKSHHCDVVVNFNIIQPAVRKSLITDDQLTILGSCFTYIKDTTGNGVRVICQD